MNISSPAYVYIAIPAFSSGLMAYLHGAIGAYWAETGHPAFASWAGTVAFILTGAAALLSWFAFYLFIAYPDARLHAESCSGASLRSLQGDAETPEPAAHAEGSPHPCSEAELLSEANTPDE